MGNYYEGDLTFVLCNDMPKEIVNDLYKLSNLSDKFKEYTKENFNYLKNTKWFKHERFNFPYYQFSKIEPDKYDNFNGYELYIHFCLKEYMANDDDLGQDIYDVLKPYIDTTAYDISNGGYIGRIYDEDCTYDKTFYAYEDNLKQILEGRKHLCNIDCDYYKENCLCDNYKICHRAYLLGQKQKKV